MEKYIKADTIIKFINGCLDHEDKITDIEKAVLTGIKTCVERIPSADVVEASSVVEIVHCKECKFGEWNAVECAYWCQGRFHIPDWYCADAESKNGGQNDVE